MPVTVSARVASAASQDHTRAGGGVSCLGVVRQLPDRVARTELQPGCHAAMVATGATSISTEAVGAVTTLRARARWDVSSHAMCRPVNLSAALIHVGAVLNELCFVDRAQGDGG